MTTGPDLIYDPDKVTTAWLTDVLTASGALAGGRVTGADADMIGTGQVGCNVRYRLTYEPAGAGPASVVAKFSSRDETSQAAGVQTLTYETEVAFYRDIADTVEISRPLCHFASVEPGTPNVVLVLEDLHPAVQGDQVAGCDEEQAGLAVVEAAKLHGPRWGDRALLEVDWLASKAAGEGTLRGAFGMVWPMFVERYRSTLTEESLAVGAAMAGATAGWAPEAPPAVTVCHADYRLDNMLFGPAGSTRPIAVVDWQTVRLGVGTSDVSYFMGTAMEPERRRACEAGLVARYHAALAPYPIGSYSPEQCWEDYRRYSFGGFFMAVFASIVVGRTARGDDMFMAMANRSAAQVMDLGAMEFLR